MTDLDELKELHATWRFAKEEHSNKASETILENMPDLIEQLEKLIERVEKVEAALKPFSELWLAAEYSYEEEPDNLGFYGFNGTNVTVGDLRTASRALGDLDD